MLRDDASWLEIDLARVSANLACWKSQVNSPAPPDPATAPVKVCGVVKADAYGLGVLPIAGALEKAGVDMLAVYSPLQAMEILDAGLACPLLVLMPMHFHAWDLIPPVHQALQAGRLHLAINDPAQIQTARRLGEQAQGRVPVHLHVDTGMSRAGLAARQIGDVLEKIRACKALRLAGVMSHLATAHTDGSFDEIQRECFVERLNTHRALQSPAILRHLAATAGACRGESYRFDMVRIGLGLWGYGPDLIAHVPSPASMSLQPVVRWRSRLVHLQRYAQGQTVGYGRTYRLWRESLLGVAATGYGDGYPLAQSNRGRVLVQTSAGWQAAPVLGRVSMDQIVLDLTDLAPVRAGALVELLSAEKASPCALPRVAQGADTSEYEILCRLSPRLPRRYIAFDSAYPSGSNPARGFHAHRA